MKTKDLKQIMKSIINMGQRDAFYVSVLCFLKFMFCDFFFLILSKYSFAYLVFHSYFTFVLCLLLNAFQAHKTWVSLSVSTYSMDVNGWCSVCMCINHRVYRFLLRFSSATCHNIPTSLRNAFFPKLLWFSSSEPSPHYPLPCVILTLHLAAALGLCSFASTFLFAGSFEHPIPSSPS